MIAKSGARKKEPNFLNTVCGIFVAGIVLIYCIEIT